MNVNEPGVFTHVQPPRTDWCVTLDESTSMGGGVCVGGGVLVQSGVVFPWDML